MLRRPREKHRPMTVTDYPSRVMAKDHPVMVKAKRLPMNSLRRRR
jgi:hypothetical protein